MKRRSVFLFIILFLLGAKLSFASENFLLTNPSEAIPDLPGDMPYDIPDVVQNGDLLTIYLSLDFEDESHALCQSKKNILHRIKLRYTTFIIHSETDRKNSIVLLDLDLPPPLV